jgi:hypothetical protein
MLAIFLFDIFFVMLVTVPPALTVKNFVFCLHSVFMCYNFKNEQLFSETAVNDA